MGVRLIKAAVVYFLIGVLFGLYMSVFHVFDLATVHVHVNLLGWMSLAIAGVLYQLFPQLAATAAARWHFWLHNIGLPVMMVGIALAITTGVPLFFPIATLGGLVTVIGIIIFVVNVLRHIDRPAGV
ncbi:cytochrome-c oxidase [Bacillus piscicola]|uniref:cytochrome-c oxidase n=1 Tax=Bacillus piscicola TaxID=1632684 RepID=UPI001F08ABD5|nr:cytochrome-c oxidase [Bacillus piscicola]